MSSRTTSLPANTAWSPLTGSMLLLTLSLLTLLLNGYHPLAEDGGLYVAGVQHTLDPSLFPHYTAFVTEHLRFSLFAPILTAIVHHTHLSLLSTLLLTDLLSLYLTFLGAHKLLQRCLSEPLAQLAGLTLLAVWWTLPIAGTSLFLMDPYVTGRSLSTPLSLLAIAFALDEWRHPRRVAHSSRSLWREEWGSPTACALCLLLAALFHPLMAGYALAFVLILRLTRNRHRILTWSLLTLAAIALAGILQAIAAPESPAAATAAISRDYWFLARWQWFELLGLAGPLLLLAALLHYRRHHLKPAAATLLRAGIVLGSIAVLLNLLFAHEGYRTHIVARMQPLRVFLLLYAVMTLLLGATLAQLLLTAYRASTRRRQRLTLITLPAIALTAIAFAMLSTQRDTFTNSPHIELPWRASANHNPWVLAFLWAQHNTPPDALFALDAKYVNGHGEDAQTFRAWSLRSALPDYSKDGGEASITPALASLWQQGAAASQGLSTATDTQRDPRLLPLGVTWVVLHSTAITAHPCPYDNGTVKVCRLTAN